MKTLVVKFFLMIVSSIIKTVKVYVGYSISVYKVHGLNRVLLVNSFVGLLMMGLVINSIIFEVKGVVFFGIILVTCFIGAALLYALEREYDAWLARR